MKVINTETGVVFAEFKDDKTIIHTPIQKKIFAESGINIPYALKDAFEGKTVVLLTDSLFKKAFIEIYFPMVLNKRKDLYTLQEQ